MKLDGKNLATLAPPARGNKVYSDGKGGLGLRVTEAGGRSWILNYTDASGKRRRYTLGAYPELNLEQARAAAALWREKIRRGVVVRDHDGKEQQVYVDPLEQKRVARERAQAEAVAREQAHGRTVARLTELWLEEHGRGRRKSTQTSDASLLRRHLLPRFGARPVVALTQGELKQMMVELKVAGIPVQANRVLGLLQTILRYGIELGWREANPCVGVKQHPEEPRSVRVARADLDRLYQVIEAHPNRAVVNAIKLLVWTGARCGEVLGAEWLEFDFERRLWIRPPERVKQKRRSVLPINDLALGLLTEMREENPHGKFLFPSPMSTSGHLEDVDRVWFAIREKAGLPTLRIHDLRHVFATAALESGVPLDTIAPMLGHSTSVMTRVYAEFGQELLQRASQKAAERLAPPSR